MEENKRTELDEMNEKKEIMTLRIIEVFSGDPLQFRDHGLLTK